MNEEHARPPATGDAAHERYRELLALELYDELDADEQALLDGHLAGCAPCRAERRALAAGLGALRPAAGGATAARADAGDVAGWERSLRDVLHAETAEAPSAPALAPVLSMARGALLAATGFAAGLLVAAMLAGPDAGAVPERRPLAVGAPGFSLPEPPPPPLPRAQRSLPGLGLLLAR